MATARIGEGKLAEATPRGLRKTTRIGTAIASPLGILVIIPGLVALVGVFLTLGGDRALRGSNLAMARERLSDQTRLVAAGVRDALDHSNPILDRLTASARAHDPNRPFEEFAHTLADLMNGRPGVAYVSVSFPDGTFQGAYLDDDRVIRFQDSRVEAPGRTRVRRYDLGRRGTLHLHREEWSSYDPRERSFFKLATERRARAWTAPYPFFKTHYTGVTRCEPVYEGSGASQRLIAVVTVDFDVNVLSSYLGGRQLPGMRTLLFSSDGTLLAYPQGAEAIQRVPLRSDRALHYSDLSDPVLGALFASVRSDGRERLADVDVGAERYLTAVAPASSDPALPWSVAYMVPDTYFLGGLRQYERRSFVIGGIAVLTAMGIGLLFARHVVRVQREATAARAEAQEARRAARELGSYRLVASLGRGGMGEVWKAEHRLLAREAAIKLIKPDASGATTEEMRARFRREAETLANLRSRNTIELFDYGVSEDGTFYFVMELLDGMDLESFVMSYGPQPASRVIQLLAQACNSLSEAHDAGLVHRDIKPANLFVCRAADELDLIKVLDFGLVRAAGGRMPGAPFEDAELRSELDEALSTRYGANGNGQSAKAPLTQAGGLMGTPGYMAPEQALGHGVDHRADLYSLGCVAFWLLTGRLVFEDENPMRLMLAHVQKPVPDLRAAVPGPVPEELLDIIAACLAKAPAERPASAREVGRALRAIVVPKEQLWTPERAEAWWNQYRPRRRSLRGPPDASREFNVAVTLGCLLLGVLAGGCGSSDTADGYEPGDGEPVVCTPVFANGGGGVPQPPSGAEACAEGPCNYQTQEGCPEDDACRPQYSVGAASIHPGCEPAGSGQRGEPCESSAQCDRGHLCAAGVCRQMCCGADWSACSAGESCIRQLFIALEDRREHAVDLCFPVGTCDLFESGSCHGDGGGADARECKIVDPTGAVACAPVSARRLGDPCGPPEVCAQGLTCVGGTCVALCRTDSGSCSTPACPSPDESCVHFDRDPPGVGECTRNWP